MKVYTTKDLEKLSEGTQIIGLGTDWTASYGLELKRLDLQGIAPEEHDWQCVYLSGKHVGQKAHISKDEERQFTDYAEAFEVDEANRLNEWRGENIKLKDGKIYGEIFEGVLQNVSKFCVVLKVYAEGNYVSQSNWPKDADGRHYYLRILDRRALNRKDWEPVSAA